HRAGAQQPRPREGRTSAAVRRNAEAVMTTQAPELFRQKDKPFVVPDGAVLGVFRIENGEELERSVKVKHVADAAKLLRDLDTDSAWLLYVRPEGGMTRIVALSESMEKALSAQRSA